MEKTVLITGCEGLIGKTLQQKNIPNIRFIGLDNHLPITHPNYGDTRIPSAFQEKIARCDGVVHLAAVSRVIWAEKNPDLCKETNIQGTNNLLQAIQASTHKPWILFGSSREVYGQQDTLPVSEQAAYRPVNVYGRVKVAGEQLMMEHQRQGFSTAILRFSNVYGRADDHPTRVIPAFCLAAAQGNPMYVEGRNHTFDFTYVHDVVDGIIRVMEGLFNGVIYPPIHLTTGQQTSLDELSALANQLGRKNSNIVDRPPRNYDVAHFSGNPERAQKLLNWQASTPLRIGLGTLIHAFQRIMKRKPAMDAVGAV